MVGLSHIRLYLRIEPNPAKVMPNVRQILVDPAVGPPIFHRRLALCLPRTIVFPQELEEALLCLRKAFELI